ncbi:MAG: HD domain-containing protein [Proteobacteria bacterium]|nr:HD domain-containing protein [Pseudomonadota bacterium]
MAKKTVKGHVNFTNNDQLNVLLNRLVSDVREFTENQLEHIKKLTQIGVALSAEKNIGRLFEMIVDEARKFTHADGGTLYIMSDDEQELRFAIVQNDTLNVRMGGTSGEIAWKPVSLKNPDGSPNHSNVSAYAAISGNVVNIPDVYDAEGFNFEGTRKFDATTGYRSKSMLVVPMRDHEQDIIGVLQLLNAMDTVSNESIPFSGESQEMTESLTSQAAVALTNNRLIQGLENLLESFITSIATAIDEKSPYTGGHVRRVAELTMTIAKKINKSKEGSYADVFFNEDQMREIRIAGWLHDVGKVTTPEYVVDKSTKLETICDRIELLKTRFEVLKRDREIELLRAGIVVAGNIPAQQGTTGDDDHFNEMLEDDLNFLIMANVGTEFMGGEKIERLKNIAQRRWTVDGKESPILTDNEISNLSIQRGTLTDDERDVINNHATVTYKMLSQLPFPKKLRNVSQYAAAHHERPNGSGYPLGLKGDQLPLQSRILGLADIFEALTAKDRPYKKGKALSEVLKIMGFMVKDGHIDGELFDFFIKEQIHLKYARDELAPQQIDIDLNQ